MSREGPESKVVKACRLALEARGCIVVKMHGNQYMPEGFPDMLVVRPDGQIALIEVKQPGRTDGPAGDGLAALQLRWLRELACRGAICGSCDSANDAVRIAFGRPLGA